MDFGAKLSFDLFTAADKRANSRHNLEKNCLVGKLFDIFEKIDGKI